MLKEKFIVTSCCDNVATKGISHKKDTKSQNGTWPVTLECYYANTILRHFQNKHMELKHFNVIFWMRECWTCSACVLTFLNEHKGSFYCLFLDFSSGFQAMAETGSLCPPFVLNSCHHLNSQYSTNKFQTSLVSGSHCIQQKWVLTLIFQS